MNQYPGSEQNPYRREVMNKHGQLLRSGMAVVMSYRSMPQYSSSLRKYMLYQFIRCYRFTGSNVANPGEIMAVIESANGRTYRVPARHVHPFSFDWFKR